MFNIERIRSLCRDETIIATQHFKTRLKDRGFEYRDIVDAIPTGEVIESYPNSYPNPSALIKCRVDGEYVHVVAGIGNETLWLVTVYRPSMDKWVDDYKTRKVKGDMNE